MLFKNFKKPNLTILIIGILAFLATILGIIVFALPKPPKIKSVSPANKETSVKSFTPIKIVFNKKVPLKNQRLFSIQTTPPFSFKTNWGNSSVLIITPTQPFLSQTSYQIKLLYDNKDFFSWSFDSESTPEELTSEEQAKLQAIGDISFNEAITLLYQKKPWLKKLPIVNNKYVIVYDFEDQAIRVRLITDATSKLSQEEQVSQIKNAAFKELENIGVNLSEEKINWVFIP
ncbi:MAG: Ig-like domain-containing protein [Microgenomates group bacterium]